MYKVLLVLSLAAVAFAQHSRWGGYRGLGPRAYGYGYGGLAAGRLGGYRAYAPLAGYASSPAYAPARYGYADDLAQPTPYKTGYDFVGDYGDHQSRQEVGDGHGNVQGSYAFTDPHGVQRQVDYVADGYGFRAHVRTNEPGTANQNPADVQVDSASPQYIQFQKH